MWYVTIKFVDYYMDYMIITPHQITGYDQGGIFKRETRSLDSEKIKTINIISEGRWGSVFNFWSIVFLSEGDSDNGDIKLKFMNDPVHLRDRIIEIIDVDVYKKSST